MNHTIQSCGSRGQQGVQSRSSTGTLVADQRQRGVDGAANVMRGVSALGIGRYALVKEIWENSPYMKSRASNIEQDLRQAVKSIDERTRQKAQVLSEVVRRLAGEPA